MAEILDEMNWRLEKRIMHKTKELNPEVFLMSAEVLSYGSVDSKNIQTKNMLLTKNYIYFISEFTFCMINYFTINRKIPVMRFEKITLGSNGKECVLHILDEDDIYLSTNESSKEKEGHLKERKFKRILRELDKAYANQTSRTLPVFRIDRYSTNKMKDLVKSAKKKKKESTKEKSENNVQGDIHQLDQRQMSLKGEPVYKSYNLPGTDFELLRGLRICEYFEETLMKLPGHDTLYSCKEINLHKAKEIFGVDTDQLYDLIKSYLSISPYIHDILLAYMDTKVLKLYSPFLQGGSLSTYMKSVGPIGESDAMLIISQVINALDVAHKRDVALGILTPNEICFTKDGIIVLDIIWTIHKLKQKVVVDLMTKETLQYTAPELDYDSKVSAVSDWWTLGAILYELVYGFSPYYHQSRAKIIRLKKEETLFFPMEGPEISEHCNDIIKKLMMKNLRTRLGWKNGGTEVKSHPWFQNITVKSKKVDDQIEIFKPEYKDPLGLDYISTDEVLLYEATNTTSRFL